MTQPLVDWGTHGEGFPHAAGECELCDGLRAHRERAIPDTMPAAAAPHAHEKSKGLQTFALSIIPGLVQVAREHGYALGVHGSLARDFDFIACPWTEEASSSEDLIEAMRAHVGGLVSNGARRVDGQWVTCLCPEPKPHGRLAWSIHLGCGAYLDVSVMPRLGALAALGAP